MRQPILSLETTRAAYPALDVPFHSRWRHFEFQGTDRWTLIGKTLQWPDERGASQGRV